MQTRPSQGLSDEACALARKTHALLPQLEKRVRRQAALAALLGAVLGRFGWEAMSLLGGCTPAEQQSAVAFEEKALPFAESACQLIIRLAPASREAAICTTSEAIARAALENRDASLE